MPSDYKALREQLKQLESEVEEINELRYSKAQEIERIRQILDRKAVRSQSYKTGVLRGNEKLVVSRLDIKPYVDEWLDRYKKANGDRSPAVGTLSQRSQVSTRTIQAIVHGPRTWITLAVADDLLTAMDISYELNNMNVVANPNFLPKIEDCGE